MAVNIFFCWSGSLSLAVAEILQEWIPDVLQLVRPFLSTENIRKGALWRLEIGQQLQKAPFGIACMTRENLTAPWVHFEAGAIARDLEESHVAVLLIDISKDDIVSPLNDFQYTVLTDKADVLRLIKTVNSAGPDNHLDEPRLERNFEKHWPDLEARVDAALTQHQTAPAPTKQDPVLQKLDDIHELLRSQVRSAAAVRSGASMPRVWTSPFDRYAVLTTELLMLVELAKSGRRYPALMERIRELATPLAQDPKGIKDEEREVVEEALSLVAASPSASQSPSRSVSASSSPSPAPSVSPSPSPSEPDSE